MNLSGYRLMWIFVMFDLPVDTKEHAREATKFREFLLDEGFEMSQFSIYFAMAKNIMKPTCGESRLTCPNAERFMCSTLPTSSTRISSGSRANVASGNEKIPINSPCFDDSLHFLQ